MLMLKFVAVLVLVYAAAVAFLAIFQRSFLYHPPRTPLDQAALQAAGYAPLDRPSQGPAAQWFASPRGKTRRVVVFLHGNSGDIVGVIGKVAPLRDAGYGVLLLEYPGFAQVAGQPTEPTLLAAATAALHALDARAIAGQDIVLWGESLGTGVAVQLAAQRPVGGLILEAPFTAVADRAQEIYWWMPARALVRDRFDNIARIAAITAPLIVVHGELDQVTPADHGRRLLAAANEPKRGVFFPRGGHIDLAEHGMIGEILRFLGDLDAGAAR